MINRRVRIWEKQSLRDQVLYINNGELELAFVLGRYLVKYKGGTMLGCSTIFGTKVYLGNIYYKEVLGDEGFSLLADREEVDALLVERIIECIDHELLHEAIYGDTPDTWEEIESVYAEEAIVDQLCSRRKECEEIKNSV